MEDFGVMSSGFRDFLEIQTKFIFTRKQFYANQNTIYYIIHPKIQVNKH